MSDRRTILFSRSRDHLLGAEEKYLAHLRVASGIGATMIGAGIACVIHGIVPGIFTNRASNVIHRLNARIAARRQDPLAKALTELEYEI